jgi:hypothetical protein
MARLLEKEVCEGSVVVDRDARIPTRDVGFVAADVYRPAGPGPSRRYTPCLPTARTTWTCPRSRPSVTV